MKSAKPAASLVFGDEAFLIGTWRRVAGVQDRGGLIVVDTTDGCRVSLPAGYMVKVRHGGTEDHRPSADLGR